MIRTALWFENNLDATELISIGRSATDDADCVMEVAGRWLCYRIALHGVEVHLAAALMDAAAPPDLLLRDKDTAAGWGSGARCH